MTPDLSSLSFMVLLAVLSRLFSLSCMLLLSVLPRLFCLVTTDLSSVSSAGYPVPLFCLVTADLSSLSCMVLLAVMLWLCGRSCHDYMLLEAGCPALDRRSRLLGNFLSSLSYSIVEVKRFTSLALNSYGKPVTCLHEPSADLSLDREKMYLWISSLFLKTWSITRTIKQITFLKPFRILFYTILLLSVLQFVMYFTKHSHIN
jgi:hypothetical protein